jgi:hypothetical protein
LPSLSEGSHREPSDWAIVVGRSRRVDQRERLPVGVLLGPGAAAGARRPDRMVAAPLTRDARDYVRPPGQVVRGRAVGLRFQNRRQSVTHYLLTRRLHGTDEGYGPVRLRPEFNGARPRGLEPRQQPCDRRAGRYVLESSHQKNAGSTIAATNHRAGSLIHADTRRLPTP